MNYTVDAVIVEGPHDKKTFKMLGYKKPILQCSTISHNRLIDYTAKNFTKIVILTDFDEEGKLLNKKFLKLFEMRRVKVDEFYRNKFGRLLMEAKISTIESIYSIKLDLFPFSAR
jgi:5S rRNA maturation endonuclease (ribonuclease M5)